MSYTQPWSRGFNAAVLHIAQRLMPGGYDVQEVGAPDSLDQLIAHVSATGRILVWAGASDRTIFGDEEVNHAFRAWHDWCHYTHKLPFTYAGEIRVAFVQAAHLVRLYGQTPETERWVAMIFAEVIGQSAFQEATGQFPVDQELFDGLMSQVFAGLAKAAVNSIATGWGSDEAAITLGASSYLRLGELPLTILGTLNKMLTADLAASA